MSNAADTADLHKTRSTIGPNHFYIAIKRQLPAVFQSKYACLGRSIKYANGMIEKFGEFLGCKE